MHLHLGCTVWLFLRVQEKIHETGKSWVIYFPAHLKTAAEQTGPLIFLVTDIADLQLFSHSVAVQPWAFTPCRKQNACFMPSEVLCIIHKVLISLKYNSSVLGYILNTILYGLCHRQFDLYTWFQHKNQLPCEITLSSSVAEFTWHSFLDPQEANGRLNWPSETSLLSAFVTQEPFWQFITEKILLSKLQLSASLVSSGAPRTAQGKDNKSMRGI